MSCLEEQDIVSSWVNGDEFGDTDRITTIQEVITLTDMPAENITHFKKEILKYCKEKHSTYICMHYFCYQNKRGSHLCNETCKWNYFFRFDTTMFVFRPLDAVSLC